MGLIDTWKNRYKELLSTKLPQTLSGIASNPTLNRWATGEPITNLKRFELSKPQVQNKIGQTAINLGMAIPESIINVPRNYVVGIARTGKEIGQSLRDKRPLNYQNLAGGVAPLTESLVDVGTMGGFTLGKEIVKQGGKQILKSGFKRAVGEGALKGAGFGAFGGLTYGLDTQYGKKFSGKELAGNVAAGTLLGGVLGGGLAGLGSIKGLLIKPKSNVDKQLRNKVGEWMAGDAPVKPEGMPKAQWDFQLQFNSKYNRNPYKPVYQSDLTEAMNLEASRRVGMQARDINQDKLSTSLPTQASKGVEVPPGLKERGFVKTVKVSPTTVEPVAEKIKGFYKPITNKETIRKASIAVDTEGWDVVKQRVLNNPLTADTNAEGLELMRRAQDTGRYDEAIEIAESLSKKGTEAGQSIQAFSIWGRMTPEGMLRYAQNTVMKAQEQMGFATKFVRQMLGKGTDIKLTQGEAARITDLMKKANATGNEKIKMQYTKEALELINNKVPYGVSDFLDEFRYNNMLSNPRSHERNIYQNALNTYITNPATLVAQGKPLQAAKYLGNTIIKTPKAAAEALKAFKGDLPIEKPDLSQLKKSRLPKLFTWPTRALEAQDKFFTTLIRDSMEASGSSAADAERISKYFTLRNEVGVEGQGILTAQIDKFTNWLYKAPKPVRWFVPFIRTPMNAMKMWLDYSPVGAANLVGNVNPREQIGKVIIGSTAMYLGAQLAAEDRTTWAAPTDATAKQLFYASGRKPFSVLLGDKWVPMWYFGPTAFAVAIPAALKNYQEDSKTSLSDSELEKATQAVGSLLKFVVGQTPLTGLNSFAKLVQGDIDYTMAGNLGFTASQTIPWSGLMNYIAKAMDPIYRKPSGFIEQIQSGIPGMTQGLKPYTEPTGEPSVREPINKFLPYDVGVRKEGYEPMLQQRTEKLQSNAVENKIKKQIEESKETQVSGNKVYYWDEEAANVKTIDLTPIKQPSLTGQEELDKIKISSYNSKVTAQIKNIAKLEELGQITANEAETKIKELTEMKITAAKAGKKPKKLTLKKITMPKISAPVKVKKIKVKRPKKTVKSLRASKAKITTKKINLNAKV